jgi:hypothetical protein
MQFAAHWLQQTTQPAPTANLSYSVDSHLTYRDIAHIWRRSSMLQQRKHLMRLITKLLPGRVRGCLLWFAVQGQMLCRLGTSLRSLPRLSAVAQCVVTRLDVWRRLSL